MPLYTFVCTACEKEHDVILGISEISDYKLNQEVDFEEKKLETICDCGSKKFKRQLDKHQATKTNWAAWNQPGIKGMKK